MAPHAEETTTTTTTTLEGVTDTTSITVTDPVLTKNPTYSRFTVDDVLPHRSKSAAIPTGVASFASADMFKSRSCFTKPKAHRWDHRISTESQSRKASSLKGAMKHFRPGMISLCGGLPSSDYFPFEEVRVKVPSPPQFSERETEHSGMVKSARKHDVAHGTSQYDLSIALNYGQSMGPPQFLRFVTEHTEIVHDPPYADWDVCLTSGSTSALEIALRMFGERGHCLLTEEYSFSSAIETALPLGMKPVGIKMDEMGMRADDLDRVLTTWDEGVTGAPKPFLVYTVPTGQNPTSSTQPLARRKQIYHVAEKHDLFILEDEPYYFLQMDPYSSGKVHEVPQPFTPTGVQEFLSSLIPSFLSLDTSGRVLRLDSFSKIIAPGSRTGWVTGSSQVIERFIRHSEVSAQNPSGFAMTALYKLLEESWGHKGFLEWLMFIRAEYTRRRDVMVNACEKYLPTDVVRFGPPAAGMFHWIKIAAEEHPLWKAHARREEMNQEYLLPEIENAIFLAAVKQNVLMARGSWFQAEKDGTVQRHGAAEPGLTSGTKDLFFRMTFAAASEEKITEAVKRFGDALRESFELGA